MQREDRKLYDTWRESLRKNKQARMHTKKGSLIKKRAGKIFRRTNKRECMRNDCKLRDANIKFTKQTCKYEPRNVHRQRNVRISFYRRTNKDGKNHKPKETRTSHQEAKIKKDGSVYVPHHARSSSVEGLLRSLTNFCYYASFYTLTCAVDWLPRSPANHWPWFESCPIMDNRDVPTLALRQYPVLIFYT